MRSTYIMRLFLLASLTMVFSISHAELSKERHLTHASKYPYLPNLYFVGASKCGTSSLARLLVQHPLVASVGNAVYRAKGESRVFDRKNLTVSQMKRLQRDRLNVQFSMKDEESARDIRNRGVIMHYTPHYIMSTSIMQKLCRVVTLEGEKCKEKRFLVMLRNPVYRTISSWWYKGDCFKNKKCEKFEPLVENGMKYAKKLDSCFASNGVDFERFLIKVRRQRDPDWYRSLLKKCPLSTLNGFWGPFGNPYLAHVGKSLYVHQLVRLFAKVPRNQTYIMILENYAENPVREMEYLFDWLRVPLYGERDGFKNAEHLYNLIQLLQSNVHPVPAKVKEKEVLPMINRMDKFFRPYNALLEVLLDDPYKPVRHSLGAGFKSGDWNTVKEVVYRTQDSSRLPVPLRFSKSGVVAMPPSAMYYYVHIPVLSGKHAIRNLMTDLQSKHDYGVFKTLSASLSDRDDYSIFLSGRPNMVICLSDPVEFVVAQYQVCAEKHAPLNFTLSEYLQAFTGESQNAEFRCPSPVNGQTHILRGIDIEELWFVAVSGMLNEALCLLYFQILGKFPSKCLCGATEPASLRALHSTSNTSHFSISDVDLINIGKIVGSDQALYDFAKVEMIKRLRIAENESGQKVICNL